MYPRQKITVGVSVAGVCDPGRARKPASPERYGPLYRYRLRSASPVHTGIGLTEPATEEWARARGSVPRNEASRVARNVKPRGVGHLETTERSLKPLRIGIGSQRTQAAKDVRFTAMEFRVRFRPRRSVIEGFDGRSAPVSVSIRGGNATAAGKSSSQRQLFARRFPVTGVMSPAATREARLPRLVVKKLDGSPARNNAQSDAVPAALADNDAIQFAEAWDCEVENAACKSDRRVSVRSRSPRASSYTPGVSSDSPGARQHAARFAIRSGEHFSNTPHTKSRRFSAREVVPSLHRRQFYTPPGGNTRSVAQHRVWRRIGISAASKTGRGGFREYSRSRKSVGGWLIPAHLKIRLPHQLSGSGQCRFASGSGCHGRHLASRRFPAPMSSAIAPASAEQGPTARLFTVLVSKDQRWSATARHDLDEASGCNRIARNRTTGLQYRSVPAAAQENPRGSRWLRGKRRAGPEGKGR